MKGRHVRWSRFKIPNRGEYMKRRKGPWFGMTPNGYLANFAKHEVTVHRDGTISVSPSIKVLGPHGTVMWHGFLERGVWREC